MQTKQVIVMRKDLNMRKGKIAAQASHASMGFVMKNVDTEGTFHGISGFSNEEIEWMRTPIKKKICTAVISEEQLESVAKLAEEKGLNVTRIVDMGLTEFNGVPTFTAIAIGPHEDSKFIGVTDHLPLL